MQPPHIWPIEKLIDCAITQHNDAKEMLATAESEGSPDDIHDAEMFMQYATSIIFHLNKLEQ